MKYLLYLGAFFLAIAWLLPNHYVPWLASHSEFTAFISAFFVVYAVLFNYKKIQIPSQFLWFIPLALIPLIQWVFGLVFFFGDAFMASAYIFSFFVMLIVGFNIGRDHEVIEQVFLGLSLVILTAGIISIYIALKQWLLLTDGSIWIAELPAGSRPFANFGQPNTLATFLLMGVASILYLYEKKYIQHILLAGLLSFFVFGVALTQSRTAWIAIPCIMMIWYWRSHVFSLRFTNIKMSFLLILFISFVIILPFFSNDLGVAKIENVVQRSTTGHNRFFLWQQLLIAIQNKPWLGYGWNQVGVAQVEITPIYHFKEWITHSHNIILDIVIWNGIPLGLLIIGAFGLWLLQLLRIAMTPESIVSLLIVCVVLVHAMFEFPLEYSFFLLPVGFLLGLIQAEKQDVLTINFYKPLIIFILITSNILFLIIWREYSIIEKDVQLTRFELLNIGNKHSIKVTPDIIFLTQLSEQIRFIRTRPEANMTTEQLEWMRQVAYRYATSAALYRYAQALALNNYPELAKKHLLIIEKLHGKKFSFDSLYQVNHSLAFEWQNVSASKP